MQAEGMLTVTELNQYLKMKLDNDLILQDVWVRGEISNFSAPSSGHLYFTLKDVSAQVRCVMFRSYSARLAFRPESGMKVILHGKVSVYPEAGQYQIYADDLQPDGAGALALQFEQLKRKLEAEGLFDTDRKKPLPVLPKVIGVITSPTGAAVQDIKNILGRRFPLTRMVLFPAMVQGAEAAMTLTEGIRFFDEFYPVDVIIIGRGGGSAEDLWAFNDETLARRIAACNIPVISAVGHETDFTICDFVADRRAPTPSAAAEIAVPDRADILAGLQKETLRLNQAIKHFLESSKSELSEQKENRFFKNPQALLDAPLNHLGVLTNRLENAIDRKQERAQSSLQKTAASLEALSPLKTMSRGYSVISRNGKTITSANQLKKGDSFEVRFADGSLQAKVEQEAAKYGKENHI